MKRATIFASALIALISAAIQAQAQWAVPPPAPAVELRSGAELDQLLAPIALYPDPLIAQILPAATQPGEIVLAARYVFGGGDMGQLDLQPFSPSVRAVARYPEVLKMMDQRLDWTAQLGQAFLYQQADVMDVIQRLRVQAQMLGNLRTTPQQCVVADNGIIEILPASPEMIYVPMYQPDFVFARRGFFLSFGTGFSIGFWLNHDCDWHHHNIFAWHRDSFRPNDWWRRSPRERLVPVAVNNRASVANRNVSVWRPKSRTPITTMNRADRGWETRDVRPASVVRAQPVVRSSEPRRETERVIQRPAPVAPVKPVVRPAEVHETRRVTPEPRRETAPAIQRTAPVPSVRSSGGAFVGGDSARDVRAASSRGQQSREAISRPAPLPPSTPSQAAPAPSSRRPDSSDRRKR